MKISKSLLSAITTGIVMATTISCNTTELRESHSEVIPDLPEVMRVPIRLDTAEVIEIEHGSNRSDKVDNKKRTFSCITCGMG